MTIGQHCKIYDKFPKDQNQYQITVHWYIWLRLVMARYGHGGKRWIRYDTAQNIAIRYDIRSQNALPYVTVNSPGLMQRYHWRVRMRSNAINGRRHSNAVHNFRQRSNVGDGTVSKLIDFSSIQTHAVNRVWPRSTAVLHCRTPSTTFDSRVRGDGLIALLDFSSVLTDVWTSLTTFKRQWEVHLRLHSSAPSQRICGRRPGTACIWVWLHTGWTTTS